MDRSEGERRAAKRHGDQPKGNPDKASASGLVWERTNKGAARDLAKGRGE